MALIPYRQQNSNEQVEQRQALQQHFRMEVDEVKKQIYKCLANYLSKEETVACLFNEHDVNPLLTANVWDELKRQNAEYFQAYTQRQNTVIQITEFNRLLQLQWKAVMQLNTNGLTPILNQPNYCIQTSGINQPCSESQNPHAIPSVDLPIFGNQSVGHVKVGMLSEMDGAAMQHTGYFPGFNEENVDLTSHVLYDLPPQKCDEGSSGILQETDTTSSKMDGVEMQQAAYFQDLDHEILWQQLVNQTSEINPSFPGNQNLYSILPSDDLPIFGNQSVGHVKDGMLSEMDGAAMQHTNYFPGVNEENVDLTSHVLYDLPPQTCDEGSSGILQETDTTSSKMDGVEMQQAAYFQDLDHEILWQQLVNQTSEINHSFPGNQNLYSILPTDDLPIFENQIVHHHVNDGMSSEVDAAGMQQLDYLQLDYFPDFYQENLWQ